MPCAWPWRYTYQEDGPRLDSVVLRPIVPLTLVTSDMASTAFALVDSSCEHVLFSQGFARAAGVDFRESQREIKLGLGGGVSTVRFVDIRAGRRARGRQQVVAGQLQVLQRGSASAGPCTSATAIAQLSARTRRLMKIKLWLFISGVQ